MSENNPELVRRIGAMIGSPGDAKEERTAISDTIARWNAANRDRGVFVEPVKWETHATPGLEGRPQGIINEELIPLSDCLIVVFRARAGSPTGKEDSGTIEEVREFMRSGKYVAAYFYNGEVPLGTVDPQQLAIRNDFESEIRQSGLTDTYDSIDNLQAKLGIHLTAIVNKVIAAKPGRTTGPAVKHVIRARGTPKTGVGKTERKKKSRLVSLRASSSNYNVVANASGRWVLLNRAFVEAKTVSQNSDQTLTVEIPSCSAEIDALIDGLRPHHYGRSMPVPFAHANNAWVVTVKDVASVSDGTAQVWTVKLVPERVDYGGASTEMSLVTGGKLYSADEIAILRAGRILLNDPPPIEENAPSPGTDIDFQKVMLESHIRGISTPVTVKVCAFRLVHKEHSEDPESFLLHARLAALFFLRAGGVVEQIQRLDVGPIRESMVHVKFRGTRKQIYANTPPTVIELEGDCPLN